MFLLQMLRNTMKIRVRVSMNDRYIYWQEHVCRYGITDIHTAIEAYNITTLQYIKNGHTHKLLLHKLLAG